MGMSILTDGLGHIFYFILIINVNYNKYTFL